MSLNSPVMNVSHHDFDQTILAAPRPAMVEFWAQWCGPCKRLAPIVDELAAEYAGRATVAKVEIDREPDLAVRLQVNMAPTLLFVRDGKISERVIGLRTKADLAARLDRLLA